MQMSPIAPCPSSSLHFFSHPLAIRLCGWIWVVSLLLPLVAVGEETDLHRYARIGDVGGAAAYLYENGDAAIDIADTDSVTALHISAAMNHDDFTTYLIARGAAIDAKTKAGFTPLHWAAARGSTKTARTLIREGANVSASTPEGISVLHWAASVNSTNIVKLLVAAGADVSTTTENGFSPLHWAVMSGSTESAFILAYRMVTVQMDMDGTNILDQVTQDLGQLVAEESRLPPPRIPEEPPLPDHSIRPTEGSFLSIPMGRDTTLEFVWIQQLGIWMGKYEITNKQFRLFDPEHNSLFRAGLSLNGEDQPVVRVPWHKAKAFSIWLTRYHELHLPKDTEFRLPTAQEWTVVAQCGDERLYPWGNDLPPAYGNHSDDTARETLEEWSGITGYRDGYAVSCPVSKSGHNEWNLYGLAGNVSEWCEDWYPEDDRLKVRCGSGWDFDTELALPILYRGFEWPTTSDDAIGMRLVVAPKEM